MPVEDFLFPPVPGITGSRILTGDTTFTANMRGKVIGLAGFALDLVPLPAGKFGVFFVFGPGTITGEIAGALAAEQAVMVVVQNGGFAWGQASVNSVAGKTGAVTLVQADITGLVAALAGKAGTAGQGINAALFRDVLGVIEAQATTLIRSAEQGPPGNPAANAVTVSSDDVRVDGKTFIYAGTSGVNIHIWTESGKLAGYEAVPYIRRTASPDVTLFIPEGENWANFSPAGNPLQPWVDSPLLPISGGVFDEVSLSNGGVVVAGAFVGQMSRVGNASPYQWYQWDGTGWVYRQELSEAAALTADGTRLNAVGSLITGARHSLGVTRVANGDYVLGSNCAIAVSGIGGWSVVDPNASWLPGESWYYDRPTWRLTGKTLDWRIQRNATGYWEYHIDDTLALRALTQWLEFPWEEVAGWSEHSGYTGPPVLVPYAFQLREFIPPDMLPPERVYPLVDAATITPDFAAAKTFTVTLGGNRTLGNPANVGPGGYLLRVKQDGTGGRTLAFGDRFRFSGGIAPVLTAAAGAEDILSIVNFGGNELYLAVNSNMLATP